MSKRNLHRATTLALAILDQYRWTLIARWTLKHIAKKIILKGID